MNPRPASTQRDDEGRLVSAVIESAPPLTTANAQNTWLLAIDDSACSLRAVAEALRMANDMHQCALHLIHVQAWLGKEAAESEFVRRGWEATARARAMLDATGQPWELHLRMGEPAEAIIALAGQLGCSGIVIGSRGLGAIESLLFGSVAYKVIHLSRLPVMMVR